MKLAGFFLLHGTTSKFANVTCQNGIYHYDRLALKNFFFRIFENFLGFLKMNFVCKK